MTEFRVKENAQTLKDSFSAIPNLTAKILDRTLEQLERDEIFIFPNGIKDGEGITKDQFILKQAGDSYLTGNIMGFLGCDDERFVIESRFAKGGSDFFFLYLLQQVMDLPNIVDLKTDADRENQLYSLLLYLFPYYLRKAMRKGLFKSYIRQEYNNTAVKGAIDMGRHIARNTPFIGKVAYSLREYSFDNPLMALIRHTIEFIETKSSVSQILLKVKDEVKLVVEAIPHYEPHDRMKVISANKRNVVRHAYYREYRALQHLCILILQQQKHQIGNGALRIYGILFDSSWLWEEYMNLLIDDLFYHPKNKDRQGAQWLFEENVGLIYPDFISKNVEKRIIADAKYKPIGNIGNRDYHQLLAYMFRFDAKVGYYLYPEAGQDTDEELRMKMGSSYEKNAGPRKGKDVRVIKHGLKISSETGDYYSFVKEMKANEAAFKEKLQQAQQ